MGGARESLWRSVGEHAAGGRHRRHRAWVHGAARNQTAEGGRALSLRVRPVPTRAWRASSRLPAQCVAGQQALAQRAGWPGLRASRAHRRTGVSGDRPDYRLRATGCSIRILLSPDQPAFLRPLQRPLMNCDWLKQASSFDCVPIRGLHGEEGIEIGTPFSYADGSAIVLYALEQGDHILLSDNGEMLAHLEAVGLATSRRRLSLLRERIAPFGLSLSETGEVRALVPSNQAAHLLAAAINSLLLVADWEREQLGVDEQTQNLADQAEILLREWKPGAALERHPKIKGQSKREHTFAFLLDGEYIDVIPANHTATGAAMRKAGDVKNSPYLGGRDIRVVIDDRREPERAAVEQQILGSLVKAMTLSRLQALAHPAPLQ
ncbi:MAG: DUF1828 domain-containing protein [Rhodocyclaceae bacterium]|nr:DUF1828 domain-containing protein [Rhodocyclaceae bacterium]